MLLKNLYESNDPNTSKVYISINLPDDVSKKFPIIENVKPHITILYLHEQTYENYKKICSIINDSVNLEPFTIDFDGIGEFNENKLVTYTKVKLCNGLKTLRSTLASNLKAEGIEWEDTYKDYIPHITLNYGKWNKEAPSGAFVCDWLNVHGFDRYLKINFVYDM
jgi:2'-5' RNA ligase